MFSTVLSLMLSLLLVGGAAAHLNKNYGIFWEPTGILLVLGGTVIVACITFSPKKAFELVKVSLLVMGRKSEDGSVLAREIITIARDTRGDARMLRAKLPEVQDLFLRDGLSLVSERIEASDIESILRDRIKVKQKRDEATANMLRTLSKYPPSFGIIGTVLGLISMMMQLGQGGAEKLGPAMAVGLVATFYGLVLTNFLLQPLAEHLALKSQEDLQRRHMALLGVMLIHAGKDTIVVQEAINSLLSIGARVDVLGLGDMGAGGREAG